MLDEYDIVYEDVGGSRISRIIGIILGFMAPELILREHSLSRTVGFRTSSVSHDVKLYAPLLLHSIMLHATGKPRIVGIRRGASSERPRLISIASALICLARASGGLGRIIKFSIVGILSILLNEATLWALTELLHIFYIVSAVIAGELSAVISFIMNDMWTFKERRKGSIWSAMIRFAKYNVSLWGTGWVGILILIALTEIFGINYLASNLVGIFVGSIMIFVLSDRWAWRER